MRNRELASLFAVLLLLAIPTGAEAYAESPPLDSALSTHQFLFDQAVAILESDGHAALAAWIRGAFLEEMKRGTIRADRTLVDSREHYHDPWTHGGLAGFRSAADLSGEQYALALERWSAGDRLGAAFHLGWATHAVQDLTVPHHARLTPLDYHTEYEGFVLANQAEAAVPSAGVYAFDSKLAGHYEDESDPWDWVDYNAHRSYERFSDVASGDEDGFRRAMVDLLPLAQRTTAGLLLSFFQAVNAPPEVVIEGPLTASPGVRFSLSARTAEDIAVSDTVWTVDGQVAGRGRDVAFTFPSTGEYVVEVTVTDALGASASARRVVQVVAFRFPTVTIIGPTTVERGVPATFEARVDAVWAVVGYDWFAEDVWMGVEPRIAMGFDVAGVAIIRVHVHTASEGVLEGLHIALVEDTTAPEVDLPERVHVRVGEPFSLDAGRYVRGEDVTVLIWRVGDDRREGGTITVRLETESSRTLTLMAYDATGNMAADTSLLVAEGSPASLIAVVPPGAAILALAAGAVAIRVIMSRRRNQRTG